MILINTRIVRSAFALCAAVGLSACASLDEVDYNTQYQATRGVPAETILGSPMDASAEQGADPDLAAISKNFRVISVNVDVPRSLKVSEANRYLPAGDIVWREDPMGDRYEQVKTIMQGAFDKGVSDLGTGEGARAVHLDVSVSRFHALTEKARYTVGGVHAIQFSLQLRDAETNAVVYGPKKIKADFDALGGRTAVQAEANGVTQKVRITNHLAYVIKQELTQPEGFTAFDTGLIGALNQI